MAELAVVGAPRNPAVAAEAARLAREAVARDPTVVSAWRTLGLLAGIGGAPDRATHLFHIAERMSRRDLPTQLWLIEERVGQNDIVGALRHYDAALRTSAASAEVLMPVLVSATAHDAVLGPLGELLASAPPWRRTFLGRMAEEAPSPQNFARLLERLAAEGPLPEPDLIAYYVDRLVSQRAYRPAWRIYSLAARRQPHEATRVRNGDFEQANRIPPFDWQLETDPALGAEQRAVGAGTGRQAVRLYASGGNGGIAARQVLLLPPGRYALAVSVGKADDMNAGTLYWAVLCGTPAATELGTGDLPVVSAQGRRHSGSFAVPATGCPAQWLYLGVRAEDRTGDAGGWIDAVSIAPGPA